VQVLGKTRCFVSLSIRHLCFYGAWSAKAQQKENKFALFVAARARAFKVKSDFKDAQLDREVFVRESAALQSLCSSVLFCMSLPWR
jgi:hypothetical protein